MQSPLQDIAEIRIGLTLRGPDASRRIDEEGLHLLRISDLTENGEIKIKAPHPVEVTEKISQKFQVRPGDLVVANRGSRMTAAIIPDGLEVVAGGQLFIVRLKSDLVTPEYLRWFLNLKRTQSLLLSRARGSYVKTLPISVLRKDLSILIPPIEIQEKIAELSSLTDREQELVGEIMKLKEVYIESALSKVITDKISI